MTDELNLDPERLPLLLGWARCKDMPDRYNCPESIDETLRLAGPRLREMGLRCAVGVTSQGAGEVAVWNIGERFYTSIDVKADTPAHALYEAVCRALEATR